VHWPYSAMSALWSNGSPSIRCQLISTRMGDLALTDESNYTVNCHSGRLLRPYDFQVGQSSEKSCPGPVPNHSPETCCEKSLYMASVWRFDDS